MGTVVVIFFDDDDAAAVLAYHGGVGKEKGRRQQIETLKLLRLARDEMDRRFSEPLDIAELARIAHMSSAHFAREFRAAYGETPHAYLMTRRIERAIVLLQGGATVTEACMAVGCSSLGSFSSSFTRLVGETPSSYRKNHEGGTEEISPCLARTTNRPIVVRERAAGYK